MPALSSSVEALSISRSVMMWGASLSHLKGPDQPAGGGREVGVAEDVVVVVVLVEVDEGGAWEVDCWERCFPDPKGAPLPWWRMKLLKINCAMNMHMPSG